MNEVKEYDWGYMYKNVVICPTFMKFCESGEEVALLHYYWYDTPGPIDLIFLKRIPCKEEDWEFAVEQSLALLRERGLLK